jgi:hypothetical protein
MPATFLRDEAVRTVEGALTVEVNPTEGVAKNVGHI